MEFKKGDRVAAFGLTGVVCGTEESITYPIAVRWDNGCLDSFMEDGRLYEHYKEPSLKLIERPKKKMKIEAWANVYSTGVHSLHYTKEDAEISSKNYQELVACVKLVSEEFEL